MVLPVNFIPATNIEELFFYQGQPITDGNLFAFEQNNPTTPKSLFSQESLLPLPNPTSIVNGKLVNEFGASIKPLYRIVDDEGNSQLYRLVVRLNDNITPETGTLVETRDNWPPTNITPSSEDLTNRENFVTNGQFRWNTTPTETNNGLTGLIQQAVTPLAAGNWLFVRDETSTAVDNVTFFRYPQYVADPLQSPRYAIQIATSSPDSNDIRKDLVLQYNNVNKFASDSQIYTYAFQAQTLDGSTRPVELFLRRNFGTGGTVSPDEEVLLASFSINDTLSIYQIQFIPGIPVGTLLGENDDDYIQIGLRFQTSIVQNYRFANFAMFAGDISISDFPITTSRDFLVRSSFLDEEPIGNNNLYLKPIRTARGFEYDYSEIGRIEARTYPTAEPEFDPDTNLLFCSGQSYRVNSYSPLGVPLRRLWERAIYNPILGINNFGNGDNFIATGVENPGTNTYNFISPNQNQTGTPVSAGTSPFTVDLVSSGSLTSFNYQTFFGNLINDIGLPAYTLNFFGAPGLISPVNVATPTTGTVPGLIVFPKSLLGIPNFFYVFGQGAAGLEGTFFQFTDALGTLYYCWFQVNGVGVDPAPGGTGILVNLPTGATAPQVTLACAQTLRGHPCSRIVYTDGNTVTGGDYWTFDTYGTAGNFYVWYVVDGVGNDPLLPNREGIQVNLNSIDSAQQVQAATHTALNSVYYAVPDYRGIFLRGRGFQLYEQDVVFNYADVSADITNGFFQMEDVLSHAHPPGGNPNLNFVYSSGLGTPASTGATGQYLQGTSQLTSNTGFAGGASTRPTNASVSYYIRY